MTLADLPTLAPADVEARLVPHEYERSFSCWRLFVAGVRVRTVDDARVVAERIKSAMEAREQ